MVSVQRKKRRRDKFGERYPLERSPFAQNPNQETLAGLLGLSKTRAQTLIKNKEDFISRRTEVLNGKERDLAVPIGKLRGVHEKLKFQLNKIEKPSYIFSPRRGRSKRDHSAFHEKQTQLLSLDIRQFYPNTSDEHIFRWLKYDLHMKDDVAGLLVKLIEVDGRLPFGSPASPVLATCIHRKMFDEIDLVCELEGLRMSIWVDDLVISGSQVSGKTLSEIRGIISRHGFHSHKIKFREGSRPTYITGVPLVRGMAHAPRALHNRIISGYADLHLASSDIEKSKCVDRLMSALGTYRYHVGAKTEYGVKAAARMNALRIFRRKLDLSITTPASTPPMARGDSLEGVPW